jgi:Putative Flp pilus-assembly TadE/G-like
MSRSLRGERGGVMVLSALMIPVFLLFAALVIDAGDWFTHKRQLQNRADAAAFAAGVEYAKSWQACVQTTDPALKLATANAIADAARQYAADPEASDYSTGTLPASLHNTEIANQSKLDVIVNSPTSANYTDDTDYTDGGAGNVANPCFKHTVGDDLSAPGYWTDVQVKERDLPSLFGGFGRLLSRNVARARVDIRPAISGHRFLPLAVPNNIITKVQVRYYNYCNGAELAKKDLVRLDTPYQGKVPGVGELWGLPNGGGVGDPNQGFTITLPSYGGCGQPYLPVGVEVRIASRDDISFETNTCAQLLAMRYADCFGRLSQIRIWNDGAGNEIRIGDVRLTGGCGSGDAYFGTLPVGATDCRFGAELYVNWGDRDNPPGLDVPGNFTVTVNGVVATQQGALSGQAGGSTLYSVPANALTANPGANDVIVSANWEDNNGSHSYGGNPCRNGGPNPCRGSVTEPVHRTFVGTQGTAGAVAMVRTSTDPWQPALPGPGGPNPQTVPTGGNVVTLFPTIGIRTVLKTGVYTTLRLDDPQANQTLQCDPDFAQGQEFSAFQYGCKPWYTANKWNSPWWIGTTGAKHCPDGGQWFSYSDLGAGFGVNGSGNTAWQCVLTAPGLSTGQVGDDMAVATDNCDNINSNSCQTFDCNYDGNYDGKTGSPVQPWTVKSDSRYPRVINLFIVPYQSSKGLTGAGDTIPVLGFASFYVMNWTGANTNQSDPCPDRTWGSVTVPDPPKGAISGVFVSAVDYEPGPVDPTATCDATLLTPCRVTLVR